MLYSALTSGYVRRNTEINKLPAKNHSVYLIDQGRCAQGEQPAGVINFSVVPLWRQWVCSNSDAYHSCHRCLQLEIGIFIDLRQSSRLSLSVANRLPARKADVTSSSEWRMAVWFTVMALVCLVCASCGQKSWWKWRPHVCFQCIIFTTR